MNIKDITKEFAQRDDCLDRMVPSDLRMLLSRIADLEWKVDYERERNDRFRTYCNRLKAERDGLKVEVKRLQEALGDALDKADRAIRNLNGGFPGAAKANVSALIHSAQAALTPNEGDK